jgi:hypothetical protein
MNTTAAQKSKSNLQLLYQILTSSIANLILETGTSNNYFNDVSSAKQSQSRIWLLQKHYRIKRSVCITSQHICIAVQHENTANSYRKCVTMRSRTTPHGTRLWFHGLLPPAGAKQIIG